MNFILFDDISRMHLLPLTYTRPVASIRAGILSIAEKWEKKLSTKASYITTEYLSVKYHTVIDKKNTLINGSILPNNDLCTQIKALEINQYLISDDILIAICLDEKDLKKHLPLKDYFQIELDTYKKTDYKNAFQQIKKPWDIFSQNAVNISQDFQTLTKNRKSQVLSSSNRVINPENVFIEEGAICEYAIINASKGPVYIAKDTEIMENSVIRGPFALLNHSVIKMSAKIYGATTIGPHSKVGGELNNVVFQGYSNKAHDGFLGNSVIGEWCNLGADSNNSNLKNTYEEVKLWSQYEERFKPTGLQFCGLIMGDHSKCGINTMFNTGTVVGVSANIFGSGFQRNFIPSFSWGSPLKMTNYQLDKALKVAEIVMNRREIIFDEIEKNILSCIFDMSKGQRHGK